jgi:hypothetical protein
MFAWKYGIFTNINNATVVLSKENKERLRLGFTETNQDSVCESQYYDRDKH